MAKNLHTLMRSVRKVSEYMCVRMQLYVSMRVCVRGRVRSFIQAEDICRVIVP